MYIHVSKVILNLQATLTTVKLRSPPWKWMVLYDGLFFFGGEYGLFSGATLAETSSSPQKENSFETTLDL